MLVIRRLILKHIVNISPIFKRRNRNSNVRFYEVIPSFHCFIIIKILLLRNDTRVGK